MKYALKFAGSVLAFHIFFCIIYYFACGRAQVPIHASSINTRWVQDGSSKRGILSDMSNGRNTNEQIVLDYAFIEVPLSFLMACTLHIVVLGSFLFVFLAGYGLAYAPLEYLNDFLNRPQIVSLIV
jgi:hypothetical protein